MLNYFEIFSVDRDVFAPIRNIQADFCLHVAQAIRDAVTEADNELPADEDILENGELIRLPGSDLIHFAYQGHPILAWTQPVTERVGLTRVHMTYRLGTLPPPSQETLQRIADGWYG